MTELAAGAVSSLLLVIRNEKLLLGGVQDDVQFIKEEMESMKSFLAHLARSAPPGGEHDEQVRTWMNQVRLLAQDCNNCIDLYLHSGNPDIHRAKGRLRRYLWWVYWFLRKLVAQHRAAVELRQLKDRARDVGDRRLRYGVEVPAKTAAGLTPSSAAAATCGYATGDDEEDSKDQLMVAKTTRTLDDHVKAKLLKWRDEFRPNAGKTFSVAIIVEPDHTYQEALALARDTFLFSPTNYRRGYHRDILVNIPAVHLSYLPLRPKEVLYYILRELKRAKSPSQEQDIDQDEGEGEGTFDRWQDHFNKICIYLDKKKELSKVKKSIKKMKIDKKLDKINSDIQDQQQMVEVNQKKLLQQDVDQLDLDALLPLLLHSTAAASQQDQVNNTCVYKLPEWDDNIILKIAKKLKKHMEADEIEKQMRVEEKEETVEQGGGEHDEKQNEEVEKEGEEDRKEEEGEEDRKEEEHIKKEKEGEDMNKEEEHIEEKEKEQEEDRNQEEHIKEEKEKGGEDMEDEEEEEDEDEEEKNDDDNDDTDDDDDHYDEEGPLHLHEDQYAQILREVFPKTISSKPMEAEQQARSVAKHAPKATTTVLNQEQIKQIIHEAKQEVLRELKEGKLDENQATSEPGVPAQNQKADFKNIIAQKIDEIKHKLKEQLKINWIVEKIKFHLQDDCPLIILKVDKMMDGSRWEEIRQALSLLQCSADALIFTTTKSTQQAEGYYHPSQEPIYYSLAGLYHDMVLEFTDQQKNEENYNPQVFRDILELCEPHEFCMKIFTHALYANPKRSNEELIKLHRTLKASSKSSDILATKMFMYSYNDLPREYKSCFLYLAIFPKGQKIRRSTLIGRWVAEGLTLKEDWPSSVRQANRCFDALIHRWLVYPADIGATGKVMSCVVGDQVHGFITTIARKQHIVETRRLSHHLARHFSIFNDLQLRSSDRIDTFFQMIYKSSRVSLLKVLDLQGCQCFGGGKNQRYLKDICTKMLLLKYLSLRGTDVTQLPSEINYLRELEVLDIRQTKLPASATANILLLKLKRLLAGNIDQSSSDFGSVQIPRRIDKMENIEVLSNFKALHSRDLKDIGKLWQLRKLGVVIKDQHRHLRHLLREISDLHECLLSLSITTLPETTGTISECLRSLSTTTLPEATPDDGTPSSVELPPNISSRLQLPPKFLESLSISGTTLSGHLLPVITKGGANKLAKVTLSNTPLNQDDLNILAKLPVLQCVRLRNIACTGRLTFNKGEFICLKYLLVEGSDLTNITFNNGAACELEKMVLSFTSTGSISGVYKLLKLEEIELHNSSCGKLLTSFVRAEKIAKLTLSATLLELDAIQILARIPNIRCLVFLDKSFHGSQNQITFNKDGFKWLNLLVVHCSSITEISFTSGSAPRLEKIVWSSFTCISGIDKLPRLKELEFNGDDVPKEVEEAIGKHHKQGKNKISLKCNRPETQDQAEGDEKDDHDAARFRCC